MISADIVFQKLKAKGGSLPYNDKTEPELIRQEFDLSKKAFKQGISSLYKDRKILITKDGISIV
jgi:predicted RNA-binding protein (virulence factor B family)